ncbi:MAG: helix-turn-helix domain-containing protein [Bryobacter sp.]|nr:helix-turn-helix domain-containing protein [Bryobacter sp.]
MPTAPSPAFPQQLKTWRSRRRLSQLDLALAANVSQRHISFLESGRAQPSRDMILQLTEALAVPLRDRNTLLLAAGFAPLYSARPLDDPHMAQVLAAVRLMLANHAPFPALALDRAWNVRLANAPFENLARTLGATPPVNLLRLFFHPNGLRPYVANWSALAPLIWCRAEREADAADAGPLRTILAELAPLQDPLVLRPPEDAPLLPVLPLELRLGSLSLSLFTVISTFGTPQDITAEELRIETFFPANDATAQYFHHAATPYEPTL